jgi:hypothetical protein
VGETLQRQQARPARFQSSITGATSFPWGLSTVDSAIQTGHNSSPAFAPDGQPDTQLARS